jgi:hypothetical protein
LIRFIPCGDDGEKSNGKGEMRGSLHCATDDTAVCRFGRDDAFSWVNKQLQLQLQLQLQTAIADSLFGMTTRKATAMARDGAA